MDTTQPVLPNFLPPAAGRRRAVVNNRIRLRAGVARLASTLRAEIVERCFALVLDRGGMRRTWLRKRENIHSAP
jgi:hypothetical protein